MTTNGQTGSTIDARSLLSTLWIFAMFNYLYADVMGVMDPEGLRRLMTGTVGTLHVTQGFLLGAAILMETAIAMVLLARILPYRPNRWANMIVGVIHTLAVLSSMFVGTGVTLYYAFFAAIEIPCTCFIVWYAWRWPNPEAAPLKTVRMTQ